MNLSVIPAPSLGDVAQGVAGLFGGGLEATGFSPDASTLLVKVVYSDDALTRTAFWTYDLLAGQYSACINTLISSGPIEVSDVSISSYNGQTQLIATYRDTGADDLNFNKLALIRNGVVITGDLVAQVCGNQADDMVDTVRVSADGRYVAVETRATNLIGDLNTNEVKDNIMVLLEYIHEYYGVKSHNYLTQVRIPTENGYKYDDVVYEEYPYNLDTNEISLDIVI